MGTGVRQSITVSSSLTRYNKTYEATTPASSPSNEGGRDGQKRRIKHGGVGQGTTTRDVRGTRDLYPALTQNRAYAHKSGYHFSRSLSTFLATHTRQRRRRGRGENSGTGRGAAGTDSLFGGRYPGIITTKAYGFKLLYHFNSSRPASVGVTPVRDRQRTQLCSILSTIHGRRLSFREAGTVLSAREAKSRSCPFKRAPSCGQSFQGGLCLTPLAAIKGLPFHHVYGRFKISVAYKRVTVYAGVLGKRQSR